MGARGCFGLPEQMENYTDNQLVSFIQKGNSDAFVELTARYLSFIRAKAYPFRSSVLEADDLCQEGCLVYSVQPEATIRTKMPALKHMRVFVSKTALWRHIVLVHVRRIFL